MFDLQRLADVFEYLKTNKHFRNQQDFVERIGSDKATVSQILNGKKEINKHFVCKVIDAFPFISESYISKESDIMVIESKNMVKQPTEVYKVNTELIELNEVVKSQRAIITSQQSTINMLTEMLFEYNKNK